MYNHDHLATLRERLRQHITTTDITKKILKNLRKGHVLFMQTAALTIYKETPFKDLLKQVPKNERYTLKNFIKEHKSKTIVAFQEDNTPLITFAFDKRELRHH